MTKKGCKKIYVPEDVCGIIFFRGKTPDYSHSEDGTQIETNNTGNITGITGKYYETIRREQLILNFNKEDQITSIELLGDKKKCQKA